MPLSNESINKTLVTLTQILDSAVERGLLDSNPARGKRRRLKTVKPVRRQLEADDLKELLAVAGEMDRNLFRGHRIGRRPMIAAMAKSGLRVTEMCRLRWRDVDVHHERLVIDEAKTDAGNRHVDLSLDVMEELMAWRAERQPASPDEYVFPTASGRPRDKENISRRVLGPTVKRANELRAERDLPPLPKVTPHALRRTYISLMIEAGAPLPYVMSQVGHADSRTTLEIYAQVQKRLSRKQVHRAFDDLLANAGSTERSRFRPTPATRCLSCPSRPVLGDAETASSGRSCWSAWSTLWSTQVTNTHPRMTHSQLSHKKSPAKRGFSGWSQPGSNRRPPACKAGALPTELWPRSGSESRDSAVEVEIPRRPLLEPQTVVLRGVLEELGG